MTWEAETTNSFYATRISAQPSGKHAPSQFGRFIERIHQKKRKLQAYGEFRTAQKALLDLTPRGKFESGRHIHALHWLEVTLEANPSLRPHVVRLLTSFIRLLHPANPTNFPKLKKPENTNIDESADFGVIVRTALRKEIKAWKSGISDTSPELRIALDMLSRRTAEAGITISSDFLSGLDDLCLLGRQESGRLSEEMREKARSEVDHRIQKILGGRPKIDLTHCNFQGVNFSGMNLDGTDFSHSQLDGAIFCQTSLIGTRFCESQLRGTQFIEANVTGANFGKSDLTASHFSDAIATATSFDDANLVGSYFSRAFMPLVDARRANFSEAYLQSAKLVASDLTEADLSFADMRNANLTFAKANRVILDNTKLAGADSALEFIRKIDF